MSDGNAFIDANIELLKQGADLLSNITDQQYRDDNSPNFNSSTGKHMRHILDHYICFARGVDDKINYDARDRDTRIETDRQFTIQTIEELIRDLRQLSQNALDVEQHIMVKSNEGAGDEQNPWSASSIKRELQFLVSHTVHHYALIAVILSNLGYRPPEEFGVAPSTLRYQKEIAGKNR